MMEQLRPDEAYRSMVTSSFSGKKGQLIGISSPKLTLCRAGITANLVCLAKTCRRWFPTGFWRVSNKYPTNPLLMDHTVLILQIFCAIRKPL